MAYLRIDIDPEEENALFLKLESLDTIEKNLKKKLQAAIDDWLNDKINELVNKRVRAEVNSLLVQHQAGTIYVNQIRHLVSEFANSSEYTNILIQAMADETKRKTALYKEQE